LGQVFLSTDIISRTEVVIKVESPDSDAILECEIIIHAMLDGGVGIPHVLWFGEEDNYNVMVMDLLGPSLKDLFNQCGQKFSLKTVLLLGIQLIDRLEFIHSQYLVHHDVKQDNFLVGMGKHAHVLYAIDFGLSSVYWNSQTYKHKVYSVEKQLLRTVHYASINAHQSITQSCRDDIESLEYTLVYFLCGSLPWQGLQDDSTQILQCKMDTFIDDLCDMLPVELSLLLSHACTLGFKEEPDYSYLHDLFYSLFNRERFRDDEVFDWSVKGGHDEMSVLQVRIARWSGLSGTQSASSMV
ncbi:casein kinase I delta, partial [Sparassis latifolia]